MAGNQAFGGRFPLPVWARIWRNVCYFVNRFILNRKQMTAHAAVDNIRFRFYAPDDVGRKIYKYGFHEPFVYRFIRRHLPLYSGQAVLDVGANLGWYSILLSQLSGERLRIYSFEPDPRNFALLQHNIQLNQAGGIQAFQLGLSNQSGEQRLYRYRPCNLGRHSLIDRAQHIDSVEVPLTTIDAFCRSRGIDDVPIQILKLDAEGHEASILEGVAASLRRVATVVLEYSPEFYSQETSQQIITILQGYGFRPHIVTEDGAEKISASALLAVQNQVDTVWLKRRLLHSG